MPVLVLLPVALSLVTPPATLSILPTINTPPVTFKADEEKPDAGLRGSFSEEAQLPAVKSSFVDQAAVADPDPAAGEMPEVQSLNLLSTNIGNAEKDMDEIEASNEENRLKIEDMKKAADEDLKLEEANRHQINKLSKMYSLLTKQAKAEEQVQATESAQQSNANGDANELAGKAMQENRALDGGEDAQETLRTQLNVLTGNLNGKVQTSQSHMLTLETWSMTVSGSTNDATDGMKVLRGDLLTLDDDMQSIQDKLFELFHDVHKAPAAPKPET